MAGGKRMTEREWHRTMAVKEFNLVWSLLEKRGRTRDEEDTMIHAAHSSRYHWGIVGKPFHLAIGEWQVSHVYAVLRRPEPALYHGRRCLDICRKNRIGDFALAFAYEALARASAVDRDAKARDRYLVLGRRAGQRIRESEDRAEFFRQFATIPGARMR